MSTPLGVRTTHPQYDEMMPEWEKCRDVAEGGTRILRQKREKYLPRYFEEDDISYNSRVMRTVLANFSWRTLVGYRGMLLRKPSVVEVPTSVVPLLDGVTTTGMPLGILVGEVIEATLITGRAGLWVNYPDASGAATQADALRLGLSPSINLCQAEAVTNWRSRIVNNKAVLSLVVIAEEKTIPSDDGFGGTDEMQYRVLELLDMARPDGSVQPTYQVRVVVHDNKINEDVTLEESIPMMGGHPLGYIPFYFISPDDNEVAVDEPPFADLIDVNLTHYEQTSAYLHGCFWSGIPQPWITGAEIPPGEKLRIGGAAWVFPTPSAKVGMLEVGAQGFIALEKVLDRLENQMVLIGSRLLEAHAPGGQESVSTAQVHLAGEHSVLSAMAKSISAGITNALKAFVRWSGADDSNVRFILNEDFFNTPMLPQERLSIVQAWQSGAISDEAKFDLLKQKGDYAPDQTFEGEQARIAASEPPDTGEQVAQPLTDQVNPTVAAKQIDD